MVLFAATFMINEFNYIYKLYLYCWAI